MLCFKWFAKMTFLLTNQEQSTHDVVMTMAFLKGLSDFSFKTTNLELNLKFKLWTKKSHILLSLCVLRDLALPG